MACLWQHSFGSTGAVLEWLSRPNVHDGRQQSISNAARADWDLGAGYEGAIELARHGWPEKVGEIERLATKFRDRIQGRMAIEEWCFDVAGAAFDVGRIVAGLPDAWATPELREARAASQRGPLTVLCNISASASVPAESLCVRGAALVAVILLLEQAGRAVEVRVCCEQKTEHGHAELDILIKRQGQPLDATPLAFWCVHPAALRRILFGVWERIENSTVRRKLHIYGNYGTPRDVPPASRPLPGIYVGVLRGKNSDDWRPERAERWILQELTRQGVIAL